MDRNSCVFLLLLACIVHNALSDQPTIRNTLNGPVEGTEEVSSMGQKYYMFRSIPFAEPPITGIDPYSGAQVDRRFKAPEPLKRKWTENLNAKEFQKACVVHSAVFPWSFEQDEDCLFLDIYVPAKGSLKKTVLVYFHGGGFTEGSSRPLLYGPDFLLSADNIVVHIQHRLGMFGFLNLNQPEYSGNMGLKDQQLGLKWVYENIENFSGNKDEIMIFGYSAGGVSAIHHVLNEMSSKYFNRAYSISGTASVNFGLRVEDDVKRIQECSNAADLNGMMDYLKSTDAVELAKCHFSTTFGHLLLAPIWRPVIEMENAIMPFITMSPEEMYKTGKVIPKDVMFGFASQEILTFEPQLSSNSNPLITENFQGTIFPLPFEHLRDELYPKEYKESLEKLRIAYYSNATDVPSTIIANIALVSDMNFGYPILKDVISQTKVNAKAGKNTFYFRMSMREGINPDELLIGTKYTGHTHADFVCNQFHCHFMDALKMYDRHLESRNTPAFHSLMRMLKVVTNFARTGDPSAEGEPPFKSCTSPTEILCQDITNGGRTSVIYDIKEQLHYDLWSEIDQIYKNLMLKTR